MLLFVAPTVASAQYYFSAQVASNDSCCIAIDAGAHSNSGGSDTAWQVIVDGTTVYDANSPTTYGSILHCFEGNGIHSVSFYVNGSEYGSLDSGWTRNIEITECKGACSVCDIPIVFLDADILDTCANQVWIESRFQSSNGQLGFSDSCTNEIYTWNYGDGSPIASTGTANYSFYNYANPGTYTVCMTLTLTNPDGGTCTTSQCTEIVVPGCDDKSCCGMELGDLVLRTSPFNPCVVFVTVDESSFDMGSCGATLSWSVNGNIISGGKSLFTFLNGTGPHEICLTMTSDSCSISSCVTVTGCNDGLTSGGGGKMRNSENNTITNEEWEAAIQAAATETTLELFPNPATNELNVKLPNDATSTVESIQVINVNGQVVKTEHAINTNLLSIDISTLAPGVYMVRTISKDGMTQTTKQFVKNK